MTTDKPQPSLRIDRCTQRTHLSLGTRTLLIKRFSKMWFLFGARAVFSQGYLTSYMPTILAVKCKLFTIEKSNTYSLFRACTILWPWVLCLPEAAGALLKGLGKSENSKMCQFKVPTLQGGDQNSAVCLMFLPIHRSFPPPKIFCPTWCLFRFGTTWANDTQSPAAKERYDCYFSQFIMWRKPSKIKPIGTEAAFFVFPWMFASGSLAVMTKQKREKLLARNTRNSLEHTGRSFGSLKNILMTISNSPHPVSVTS